MENKHTAILVSNPEPDFTCYLRGRLYSPSTHAMLPTCSNRQVKYFRKIILTVLYIALLSCPTSAFPKPKTRIKEEGDKTVTIQVTGCRRTSNEDLRRMMGPAFDDSKMAYDDVKGDASTGYKRGTVKQSVISKDKDNNDFLEEVEDFFDDEEELDGVERSKTRESSDKSSTISVQNRKYMRRKRETPQVNDENTNSLSDKNFLYQNMLHETVRRKRSSRERRSAWNHHQLTWECRKKDKWMKMKEGYFPSRIMEVKCKQKDCFFGMYTCNPVKYTVRVLKRDPVNACNPVPLISNTTVYEEVWNFKKIRVTVACECGNSWKSKKRKMGRSRSRG